MRILISWTGSRREPFIVRAGALLPGAHLQLLRDSKYRGQFDAHYLLAVPQTLEDAEQIVGALAEVDGAPPTEVRVLQMLDPTDHNEIFYALAPFLEWLHTEHEGAEFFVMLNTGTPQMQTLWVLLKTLGLFDAKILQTSPAPLAQESGTPEVREFTPNIAEWRQLMRPNVRRPEIK
ncbi:MAG: hypothetical protein IT462_07770 [Planctomycetes bacterium]|nr:hypothetical protein [Planctomycetota bacterium]